VSLHWEGVTAHRLDTLQGSVLQDVKRNVIAGFRPAVSVGVEVGFNSFQRWFG
jgi:hypothetical protein